MNGVNTRTNILCIHGCHTRTNHKKISHVVTHISHVVTHVLHVVTHVLYMLLLLYFMLRNTERGGESVFELSII
jgi:predicted PurR-regulated permease PerM